MYLCVRLFTEQFLTVKVQKQPKYLSKENWLNKLCYIHTMEFNAAKTKTKELGALTVY